MSISTEYLVSPCGKICKNCIKFAEGDIAKNARSLLEQLQGYDGFIAEELGFAGFRTNLEFMNYLNKLAGADCPGCRNKSDCKRESSNCTIAECKFLEYKYSCAECSSYPCERYNTLSDVAKEISKDNIESIKRLGASTHYTVNRNKSNYSGYMGKKIQC